ncbi:MAG: hypothetical protein AB7S69_04560 [Salinivirgaceae bacterium]
MVKIISVIFFGLISFSIVGQTYSNGEIKILKKHSNYLKENYFNELNYHLIWHCSNYSKSSCFERFTINSEQNDSIWSISFLYWENEFLEKHIQNRYKIIEYSVSYCLKGREYFITRNSNNDTIMYFSYPKNNRDAMTFFVGKYTNLFENIELTPRQLNYYLKYQDSLIFVKGNNLPPLPEIDLVENDSIMNLYIQQGKDFYYPKLHDKKVDYCDEANW